MQKTMNRIDGIEIVNGGAAEGPLAGWPFWASMLNRGLHLTAVGGSDEHTADEISDRAIGVPATVVLADELSEPALVDGLRHGHAYVRTRGPKGPALDLERMGETVPADDLVLRATVSGASGQKLQWIRNGEVVATQPVTDGLPLTLAVHAQPRDWFSVVVRDDAGPTLFSNAIFVSP